MIKNITKRCKKICIYVQIIKYLLKMLIKTRWVITFKNTTYHKCNLNCYVLIAEFLEWKFSLTSLDYSYSKFSIKRKHLIVKQNLRLWNFMLQKEPQMMSKDLNKIHHSLIIYSIRNFQITKCLFYMFKVEQCMSLKKLFHQKL